MNGHSGGGVRNACAEDSDDGRWKSDEVRRAKRVSVLSVRDASASEAPGHGALFTPPPNSC
jgi:hypothetical protein